ncbi:GH1 family beta-glucosidase [Saccharopolyspora hirsuta]|uniref:Beta-glucosidase n=1 Tax=Saccharopolyspora hirsuta TaxID=1837 RepID=A0A5M7CB50_SACHI|nr:GH1 family beta-glucosidase [Saccharopolyspora hirsuta]KAA5836894.1 beta-glucosidase [Saccharopolyspora hirsuta]
MTGFPPDFTWGVAASAYQVEGAASEDGRTPSIWDSFAPTADGSTGDVACDHYHRFAEDVALMAELGIDSYRLSVSWSRVVPDASGKPNPAGLDFYDRLLDALADNGISPAVNLFHWDLPQWAQDAGGWQQRDTVARFAEYAEVVVRRLGDRVGTWSTINEMFEHFALGHVTGEHAPGLSLPLDRAAAVAHNLLLASGRAAQVLREHGRLMGITSYAPARPHTDSDADREAAALYDVLQNRLFTDPVLLGRYPAEVEPLVEPFIAEGDLAVINTPPDLWGVNYYSINSVRATGGEVPLEVLAPEGFPRTAFGWAVAPEGLTEVLTTLHERYAEHLPPLVITENGCAYDDTVDAEGRCDDLERVVYLDEHLNAVRAAMNAGVDVRGYYVWSLLDNFEWAEGCTKRFGLVHVDFETQRRTPKTSFGWYRDRIAASR